MIGKVKIQPINAYLMCLFQPKYERGFTDEFFVFGSEILGFGQIFEENYEKNSVGDTKEGEINILGPFKESLL